MKKFLFILFILLQSTSIYAQVNLDSLLGIWKDNRKADTVRMEALNKFIEDPNTLHSKLDTAQVLSQLIYDLAIKTGSRKYEAIGLNHLGACNAMQGNAPNGIKMFEESLKINEEIGDYRGIFHSIQGLGVTYSLMLADIPKGKTYLSRSLKVAEENNYKEGMAKVYFAYGNISQRQNKILEAREYFLKALEVLQETENKVLVYQCNQGLGVTYAVEGNYSKAIDYYTIALRQTEEHGNQHQSSHILTSIGGVYLSLEDYAKSLDYLSRALDLMEEGNEGETVLILKEQETLPILLQIGNIYTKQKKYPKAMEYFFNALKISEASVKKLGRVGNYFVAASLQHLANVYKETGDYKNALDYGMRGLKIAEELGWIVAEPYAIIGNTYRKTGQFTKAITWCNKSLKVSEDNLYIEGQKVACECLYEAYKSTNQASKALAYHEQFVIFSDSLQGSETGKKLQRMEFSNEKIADSLMQEKMKLEVQVAHESEIHKKNNTRNIILGSGLLVLLMAGGLWSRLRLTKREKAG